MRISADPPRPADLLLSPLLLASLALLVVNDWILKPAFHNAVTGKLSDVAGVAALTLFLRALLPRHRWMACAAAGAMFVLWKSPAAQPLIDAWNGLGWWTAGRVVDWTDLAALLVLPSVRAYRPRPLLARELRRRLAPAVAAACVLAFAATSAPRQRFAFPAETEHAFADAPEALLMRMYDLRVGRLDPGVPRVMQGPVDTLDLYLGDTGYLSVRVELRPGAGGSVLRLLEAAAYPDAYTAESARHAFEAEVIEPLRRNTPDALRDDFSAGPSVEALGPRVLAPRALYEPRDSVRVALARPAYLALVEITPQETWHVIFPADADDERLFGAGEHVLATACARRADVAPVPPGRDVPACAVARRGAPCDDG